MTTWVDDDTGGRPRGLGAIWAAWVAVMVRPRQFFRGGVAPGDQSPGLTFALVVVAGAAGTHLATRPAYATVFGEYPLLSLVVVFLGVVLMVAPVVLHFAAALQTVGLIGVVPSRDRGGVSETVQVIGYACAPCVFAGLPLPPVRVACAVYGFGLLVLGTTVVHRTTWGRAVTACLLPGLLVFGYGFGGIAAVEATAALLT